MELGDLFLRAGVALGLGLLVGLQRERTGAGLAGFRTFALVTLYGAVAGLLSEEVGSWILSAGLLGVAVLVWIGTIETMRREAASQIPVDPKPGLTTEVSMLLMYVLGAFTMVGHLGLAVAIGGVIAVLLHLKEEMHSVARRLEDADFRAIMQFVLITLVILPILPDRTYGPYDVLNPYKIWLMVVLIVGISLGGYIIYKFFGGQAGALAGGVLGGLISSTATTVSYARRTKNAPQTSALAALVIMVASTIVFVRVLILMGATAPEFLRAGAGPIGTVFAGLAMICLAVWWFTARSPAELPRQGNPSELKAALIFAGLYALVLLGVAAAKQHFGQGGLYVVSILSGLTDMDAITLSISGMVPRKEVPPELAWRLILVAALSNLFFKAVMVGALGNRSLLLRVLLLFGLAGALTLGVIFFWP